MRTIGKGRRYGKILAPMLAFSLGWIALGLVLSPSPAQLLEGMRNIFFSTDMLITDYMDTAGIGPAFVNAGLVCLLSLALLYFSDDPVNGFTIVVMSLMAGFALFGKNLLNITPIIVGTWLYSRVKQEPFSKYVSISLLATSLAPMVSYLTFHEQLPMPLIAILVGLLIGFVMPPLAAYTFRIQNGMNLYNAGFACGILGMVLVPVFTAMGYGPEKVLFWATGHNVGLGIGLGVACLALILFGMIRGGRRALRQYWVMLHTSGRAPSDYLRAFGVSPVCINMGVNGLMGGLYILLVGGDLNGPTLGGIITVMGFSAYGKHLFNIAPVMLGVLVGNVMNNVPMDYPSMQLAGLFGTTLAPIAGVFGWPYGILAGLLHSSVVLHAGAALEGMNLYHNGFSGGLLTMVLYPILTAVVAHRKPTLQEEDYYDMFEDDSPLTIQDLEFHKGSEEEEMPH